MTPFEMLLAAGWLATTVLLILALVETRKARREVAQARQLAAALGEVAAAIRERGPDLHVQLRDVPPHAAGEPKS